MRTGKKKPANGAASARALQKKPSNRKASKVPPAVAKVPKKGGSGVVKRVGATGGGQIAINGFAYQVLACAIEAFDFGAWRSLSIEPSEDKGGTLEKVDILWVKHDLSIEYIQVKHMARTLSRTRAVALARQLRVQRGAAIYRLVIFGQPGAGLTVNSIADGVRIEFVHGDVTALLRACSQQMQIVLGRRGRNVNPEFAQELAGLVVAQFLLESRAGKVWGHDEFFDFLWRWSTPKPETSVVRTSQLIVKVHRTIEISATGLVDEYVRYSFVNPTEKPEWVDHVQFIFTEHDDCVIRRVADSKGESAEDFWTYGRTEDGTVLQVILAPREPVLPGQRSVAGVHVQRDRGIDGQSLYTFHDTLLPTPSSLFREVEVVVVLPKCGRILADGAEVSPRTARWIRTIGRRIYSVTLRCEPDDRILHDPVAEAYLRAAREDLGLLATSSAER